MYVLPLFTTRLCTHSLLFKNNIWPHWENWPEQRRIPSGRSSSASEQRLVWAVKCGNNEVKDKHELYDIFFCLIASSYIYMKQCCIRVISIILFSLIDRLMTDKLNASASSQPGSTQSSCVNRQLRQHTVQVCKTKHLCEWMVRMSWLRGCSGFSQGSCYDEFKYVALHHLLKALYITFCASSYLTSVSVTLRTVYGSFDVTLQYFV